jgi:hypothetical protein
MPTLTLILILILPQAILSVAGVFFNTVSEHKSSRLRANWIIEIAFKSRSICPAGCLLSTQHSAFCQTLRILRRETNLIHYLENREDEEEQVWDISELSANIWPIKSWLLPSILLRVTYFRD